MAQAKRKSYQSEPLLKDAIISLIIVTDNDDKIIEDRLKAINRELSAFKTNYEILVVDNRSEDATVETIRKMFRTIPHIRVLVLSKKYKTEIALTAGLDNCVGDYANLFNIYTDPPSVIVALMDKLLASHDIVIGQHTHDLLDRDFASRALLTLVKRSSTHGHRQSHNYLVGLNRKAINSITRTRRKSRNFGYISSLIGLKSATVKYKPLKKFKHKVKKENLLELFFTVTDRAISNSFKPMRVFSFLGMLGSTTFLFYIAGIVILEVFFKMDIAPKGWISIATVMAVLFLLLFSLLTLISEYVIRIANEVRNEPFYFIADELDKSVILPKKDRLNVV